MKKEILKSYGFHVLILFLLLFMLMIFGPAELFFANEAEFDFVYGEFATVLTVTAIAAVAVGAGILLIFPQWLKKLILSGAFGASVAGYLQIMFLNGHLDLLGESPLGYQLEPGKAIFNLLIWLLVIGAVVFVAYYREQLWKQLVTYVSAFLLAIQCVALVSLFLTAEESAYKHPDTVWYLSGEEQFQVSSRENVIVLLLDYYSNQYIESTKEIYPDVIDFLNDFTYYSNVDASYFGTFPSMISTFAGVEYDPSISINDWCYQAWTSEKTIAYYNMLKEMGYKCNMHTTGEMHLCASNDRAILKDIFSNAVDAPRTLEVSQEMVLKKMTKMSLYRMLPEVLKPRFYTKASEYTDMVTYVGDENLHSNYEFYEALLERGLSLDDSANYFTVQHLSGGHEFSNDAECKFVENEQSGFEETYKGAMVMVEEYLNQLKQLGVYDNSTIIITSDHGSPEEPQVIFFVKESGETHEEMQVSNAPLTLHELLPTIAKMVGADYEPYGKTIYDYAEDELRERSVWVRRWDDAYNANVMNFSKTKDGEANIYKIYTYTGDFTDLKDKIDNDICEIYEMTESFY